MVSVNLLICHYYKLLQISMYKDLMICYEYADIGENLVKTIAKTNLIVKRFLIRWATTEKEVATSRNCHFSPMP